MKVVIFLQVIAWILLLSSRQSKLMASSFYALNFNLLLLTKIAIYLGPSTFLL